MNRKFIKELSYTGINLALVIVTFSIIPSESSINVNQKYIKPGKFELTIEQKNPLEIIINDENNNKKIEQNEIHIYYDGNSYEVKYLK
ncbi:MAG: hypothetical protein ACOYT4_00615 [Nanoarchaeota archaeon]